MEREVRYCTTRDGIRIAYSAAGNGPILLHLDVYNTQGGWQPPMDFLERFATVVRYHPRGMGLSDRDAPDLSLEANCLDVEAVLTHMGGRPALILSDEMWGTILALAFAARHPRLVDRMALVSAWTSLPREVVEKMEDLFRTFPGDLRSVFETHLRSFNGWEGDENVIRAVVRSVCESMSFERFAEFWRALADWDTRELIADIAAPTLLVYPSRWMDRLPEGREIIGRLQNGRMVVVDDANDTWRAIVAFLSQDERLRESVMTTREQAMAAPARQAGTVIILFTDIVDSTGLTERLGDAAFRAQARALDSSLRSIIADAGGSAIDGKLLGDGVLATFPAASHAIDAALRCASAGNEQSLPLHLGLHAGDVIREQNNVFGGAVTIASRICGLSVPGEVLVSDVLRGLARTSAGVTFEDRGEHTLKGVADPQRIYAVRKQA